MGNGTYWPFIYDMLNNCFSIAGTPVVVFTTPCESQCVEPGAADTGGGSLPSLYGVTALDQSQGGGVWPGIRTGAWLVLEAKTKGFVVNRIPTTAALEAMPDPVEGMMVYDQQAGYFKIYTTTDNGNSYGWRCFSTPACPDEL